MTTTTPADQEHVAVDGSGRDNGSRVDHPRVDVSGVVEDVPGSSSTEPNEWQLCEWQLRELLAPFVAWLATQDLDEAERRRHRDAAERFLRWCHTDSGPVEDQRHRYEHHLQRHDPDHRRDAHAGLGWWTHHRQVLAWTLPTGR